MSTAEQKRDEAKIEHKTVWAAGGQHVQIRARPDVRHQSNDTSAMESGFLRYSY